jgi:hypothetical protein
MGLYTKALTLLEQSQRHRQRKYPGSSLFIVKSISVSHYSRSMVHDRLDGSMEVSM